MEKTWNVVVAEPGKKAEVRVIPATCEALCELVGCHIELTQPLSDDTAVLCNEMGKQIGLPVNRILKDRDGNPVDVYCGTIVCIGYREKEYFDSLTDLEQALYRMIYDDPDFVYHKESEDEDE
jgi:hypothetical protein